MVDLGMFSSIKCFTTALLLHVGCKSTNEYTQFLILLSLIKIFLVIFKINE